MTDARKAKKRTPNRGKTSSKGASRKKFTIDLHAHIIFSEATKFARKHVVSVNLPKEVMSNPVLLQRSKKWHETIERRFTGVENRLKDMDKAHIDVQVLTGSLVHQNTNWADPEKSLKIEQLINNRIAEIVHSKPDRYVGLGACRCNTRQWR